MDELSTANAKFSQAELNVNELRKRIMEMEAESERKDADFRSKMNAAEQGIKTLEERLVQAAIDREVGSRDLVKRVADL